jgi:hypothetical protein
MEATMIRWMSAFLLSVSLAGCGDARNHAQAVYVLVDTSGTFVQEANKAQVVVNYLLGTLQPGDSLAVARVESRYTDITGGLLQGAEFLNETGAGTKTLIIFSDMQEELDKVTLRDIPMNLKNIRVVAVNVVKLKTDNIDPRRYFGRLEAWQKRVKAAGASEWVVINDLERLDAVLGRR